MSETVRVWPITFHPNRSHLSNSRQTPPIRLIEPEIWIEHHPGPAPGAIWVEIPSKKIVFVGDAVVEHQPPFLADADLPAWIETLSVLRIPKYRDYTIVSGRSEMKWEFHG